MAVHRKLSLQALPVALGFLLAMMAISAVFGRVMPTSLSWVLIGVAAATVMGDIINILYLSHRLHRANASRA
jgi:hypothetical protein